jgi:hypothetical protein
MAQEGAVMARNYINYTKPVMLNTSWQWSHNPHAKYGRLVWALKWARNPGEVYAYIYQVSDPSHMKDDVFTIVMSRTETHDGGFKTSHLDTLEGASDTVEEAMQVAETHILFTLKEV